MDWKPISREQLLALVRDGTKHADDDVLETWNAMRVEPEKWQCSPEGDLGGGFWVVAVTNGSAVWYNDIEDGFNVSPFDHRGVIGEYRCSQSSFSAFLQTLPVAREAARRAPPGVDSFPSALATAGRIVRRQTTYWTLESADAGRWRVHFRGKLETRYAQREFPTVQLMDSHPLLQQFEEPWYELNFLGRPESAERTEEAMSEAVIRATRGWRALNDYRNSAAPLEGGHGLLMRAPLSVVVEVETELRRAKLRTTKFESNAAVHDNYSVLLFGRSYIIAKAFGFERW